MNTRDIKLFIEDEIDLKKKFILFMDLLINNQSNNYENFIFLILFSIQNISIYFSEIIGVLKSNNSTFDKILIHVEKIIRIKSLFFYHKNFYIIMILLLFIYYFFFTFLFIYLLYNTKRKTTYSIFYQILNFFIKCSIYLLPNITLDFFTHLICLDDETNVYIPEIKCNQSNNMFIFIISLITTLFSQTFIIFIHLFYEDNLYNSESSFCCSINNLYLFQHINLIITSFTMGLYKQIHFGFFFLINFVFTFFLFLYFINRIMFYHPITNLIYGLSFFLNLYTNVYFFAFKFIKMSQKGLIYIISCIFVSIFYIHFYNHIIEKIIKKTPYHEINNKFYLLYYIKFLINLIEDFSINQNKKALLIGIMEIHAIECPNQECLTKNKKKIYLPIDNSWSDRTKSFIYDKIFLKTFIVVIINYYLKIDFYSPELVMNLSHYYLNVIGNVCLCVYHCKKAKQMNLNIQEKFLLERLKIKIENKLIKSLKDESDSCLELEDLNVTLFYKYNNISKKFIKEIYNDLDLNIEFWEYFSFKKNTKDTINFNKIFKVIEKINISKSKIKKLWNEMFEIYSGINIYFLLYLEYIIEINDDTKLKTELERYKKKRENSTENIITNYYNLLFNKDTGIAIINGDKGKEGIIEKVNYSFGKIFHCNSSKIKGKYITDFMPKIFSKDHSKIMKNYFDNGRKIVIDKGNCKIFGIDKYKYILQLQMNIKVFPILNDYLYYVGLINLDKIDDIILVDSEFIIQGMSKKLIKKFKITNENLFMENDIPFYIICKNFIRFYKTFFNQHKINKKINRIRNSLISASIQPIFFDDHEILLKDEYDIDITPYEERQNSDLMIENIEDINENMEIEYEIQFPNFLSQYSYFTNNMDKDLQNQLSDSKIDDLTSQNENDDLSNDVNNSESKNKNEKDDEETPLILKSNRESNNNGNRISSSFYKNSKLLLKTPIETPMNDSFNINNTSNIVFYDYGNTTNKQTYKNEINYENEGKRKLNLYISLFKQGKFNELENFLDKDLSSGYIGFKFNFSLEKFFYYENKLCFIIRCIENKIEDDNNINELSQNNFPVINLSDDKILFSQLNEISENEKKQFFDNIKEFQNIKQINKSLKELTEKNYIGIKTKSRIYGEKSQYQNQMFNENASQAGDSNYNSNLSKLNRIIESRENLLQNATKFYILKYMNLGPFIFLIGTTIFAFLFCLFTDNLTEEIKQVRYISSIIYKIQIETMKILNLLIDYLIILRVYFARTPINLTFGYSDLKVFIMEAQNNVTNWYYISNLYLNYILKNIGKYLNDKEFFWSKINITNYISIPFDLSDYFPFIVSASLYDAYFLFSSNIYSNYPDINITNDQYEVIIYSSFISINGTNKFILPIIYNSISTLIDDFLQYNINQFNKIKYSIILFLIYSIISGALLFLFIFISINHLGIGIQKVSKISQSNIANIICNIDNFKNVVKFRYKLEDDEDGIVKTKTFINTRTKKIEESLDDSNIHNELYEYKKYKKIKLESFIFIFFSIFFFAYILCFAFLYVIPKRLVFDNENLIKSESYILQQFFYTSILLYRLKCIFTGITSLESFDYTQIVNESFADSLYKTLQKFKSFYDFYYIGFKLDACYSLFDKGSDEYNTCKNSEWPILLNNTESFKEYIIRKLTILEIDFYYQLNNNKSFDPIYMFDNKEYLTILGNYELYYINVFQRFEDTIQDVLVNRIKNNKRFIYLLSCVLVVLSLLIFMYTLIFLQKYFYKMFIISKSFIQIIPTYLIFNTPALENWLEKEGKI